MKRNNKTNKLVTSAIASILSLVAANIAYASSSSAVTPESEKCYGVVKKGMNDCKTAVQSCAGSSTVDSQGDAFIFLPKSVCNKLVNGVTEPVASAQSNMPQTNITGHDQTRGQSIPNSQDSDLNKEKQIPEEERD